MTARTRYLLPVLGLLLLAGAAVLLQHDPELYTLIIVHLTTLPAVAYPLVYRNSPWKSGPTGRALMNMARSMALLFVIAIIGFWWPFPGFQHLYAVAVTYLGVAISYQLYVMICLKRRALAEQQPGLQP